MDRRNDMSVAEYEKERVDYINFMKELHGEESEEYKKSILKSERNVVKPITKEDE